MDENWIAQVIRKMMGPSWKALSELQKGVAQLKDVVFNRPPSPTEEIDRIPGRRHWFSYTKTMQFDISLNGSAGQPMPFQVSQDGPFVMTHYPLAIWRPIAPDNATNFGMWRPTSTWPLPDQVVDSDIIDLSYVCADGGNGRNYQDGPVPAALLSRPDSLLPLPVPTLFETDSTFFFTPTFENISFGGDTPTTAGLLVVVLPGYRIVSM